MTKQRFIEHIKKEVDRELDSLTLFEERPITLNEIKSHLRIKFDEVQARIAQRTQEFFLNESDYQYLEFVLCQRAVDVDDKNKTLELSGGEIRPWLNEADVQWRFWERYKEALKSSDISLSVIQEHENLLRRVLDLTGDPKAEGMWRPRKGLVMGNVQAGKTMNFIGLINKAIDVGYHTIVILGGHMDELRNQAQGRIDKGFPDINELPADEQHLLPHRLTTVDHDFRAKHASATAPNLIGTPSITVMKKNTSIMKRFNEWISQRGSEVFKKPFLLIDDEADYASINTKHAKKTYTSTNQGIRDMLGLFEKPTYVAYTATPFANVFIPFKETVSGIEDDDLFPSDFMLRMPIPDNYKGQDFFFPDRDLNDDDPIRLIDCVEDEKFDFGNSPEDWLPLKHKKDVLVSGLHHQLEEAVLSFLLALSIKYLRGFTNTHSTMLVNVTRFNDVQFKVASNLDEYLEQVNNQIKSFGAMAETQALANSPYIRQLKSLYLREFSNSGFEFPDLLDVLVGQIHRVKVEMVNRHASRGRQKSLDYESREGEGYWVIAVGGLKLSRGLTLEGLTTSFFLRNAAAYDTLTQMCRWYGYRDGYDDLCRLYLLPEALDHYTTVSQSIRELYDDLRMMQLVNGKPRDFGLKVRASDTALLVTAKNKMGSGERVDFNYQLWGEEYKRIRAWASEKINNDNFKFIKELVQSIENSGAKSRVSDHGKSHIFERVEYSDLIKIIENVNTPISGKKNEPQPIIKALQALEREKFEPPKLILYSRSSESPNQKLKQLQSKDGSPLNYEHTIDLGGKEIWKIARTFSQRILPNNKKIIFTGSSAIGDSDDLKNIFTTAQYDSICTSQGFSAGKLLNKQLRTQIQSPVMIVYLVSSILSDSETNTLVHEESPTVMYMLHFPSKSNNKEVHELSVSKSYVVNEILRDINAEHEEDFDDEDADDENN